MEREGAPEEDEAEIIDRVHVVMHHIDAILWSVCTRVKCLPSRVAVI